MRLLIAGLLTAAVAGCALWQQDARRMQFDSTVRAYARVLEWSDFENVVRFAIGPGNPAPPDPARYRDVKITAYEPGRAALSPDGRTVIRVAQVRYVLLTRMAERSATVEEEWVYLEDARRWYLRRGLLPPVGTARPQ